MFSSCVGFYGFEKIFSGDFEITGFSIMSILGYMMVGLLIYLSQNMNIEIFNLMGKLIEE